MAFLQCKKCPRSTHIQPYGPAYVTYRDCLGRCASAECNSLGDCINPNKDEASTAPTTTFKAAEKYPVLRLKKS